MSLQIHVSYQVPETTARIARAIFPHGNLVMRMYDELGMLFQDHEFADLYPTVGQPAAAPFRLAFVTTAFIRQFLGRVGPSELPYRYFSGGLLDSISKGCPQPSSRSRENHRFPKPRSLPMAPPRRGAA